ncbi:MAG: aconitate hydratase, partial [Actinomycetia bacterium]|nr:aconitate hydratase [Actinomycetes bacterium]
MEAETWPPQEVKLTPGKRVLFLTKDPDLVRKQLYEGLDLRMEDISIDELLDDINTDVMTPAWVCFDHDPAAIAENAYAGLLHEGSRVLEKRALIEGGFEVIVSGHRKGTGSSRETAAQCERWAGIRIVIAASFAPIHERNNINLGQLMGDHAVLQRLQDGESIPLEEFTGKFDPVTRLILENGGLLSFARELKEGRVTLPDVRSGGRPMTMAEKIISSKLIGRGDDDVSVAPGDAVLASVDGGYSHEYTTAQVHSFLSEEYGNSYQIANPSKFAVFEDHLLYATDVPRYGPFVSKIETLREMQRVFQKHTGVRDYSAEDGISPGICHQVAREEFIDVGDFIQATDSH